MFCFKLNRTDLFQFGLFFI